MTRVIMIQGTSSGAGKSLTVAGLCRIFRQDGYRVAPFKSQNMGLNFAVMPDGLEMSLAQIVQAEAAGIEPGVLMNPILLKPTGEAASQVVVNGVTRGTMGAAEYFRRKTEFLPDIRAAYQKLAERHDIVVIEGAGSPAEINLRENDIVNMGMAALADAPVLLVGDIDRGGVFASLFGTVALLEPDERERIRGFVINKFRGDAELLRPGLRQLEELTGIPTLGVVPWTPVDIDDEDSLTDRFRAQRQDRPVDVAIIKLPRMVNFTDFLPLGRHPALGVRYVTRSREIGTPDCVIIPQSQNPQSDREWMRETGIDQALTDGDALTLEAPESGMFDKGGAVDEFARTLLARKGMTADGAAAESRDSRVHREGQYDILADVLRNSLDMKAVYSILDAGNAGSLPD